MDDAAIVEFPMPLHSIIRLDVHIFAFINSHHTAFFDYFFWTVTQLGNAWVVVPLGAVIIVAAAPRRYLVGALVCAAVAGAVSGILSTQIKRVVDRPRPLVYFETHPYPCPATVDSAVFRTDGECRVHVVGKPLRRHSFPSGHSVTAFTAATILAVFFGGYYFLTFVPALLVAYSRIYMGVHFPLDTLAGAAMGISVALLVITVCRGVRYLPPGRAMGRKHAGR